MLKTVLAAVLTITIAVPAAAAEKAEKPHKAEKSTKAEKKAGKSEKASDKTAAVGGPFYVVRDGDKPCAVSDKDPGDWGTAKALGEYSSKAEAEKNVDTVCGKEAPKKKEE